MDAHQKVTPKLVLDYTFGRKEEGRNLRFVSEYKVAYLGGHALLIQSIEDQKQSCIVGANDSIALTYLAVSPDRKYIAVASRGLQASASVYSLNNLALLVTLLSADSVSNECTAVSFSNDSRFLITLGGQPQWMACYWKWEKSKLLACTSISRGVYGPNLVSFNPFNPSIFCCTGIQFFSTHQFQSGKLKTLPTPTNSTENIDCSCHVWLDADRLLLCTQDGDICLIDKDRVLEILECSPKQPNALRCIVKISNGFICGGDAAFIRIFEASEIPNEIFKQTSATQLKSSEESGIVSIALSPSETKLAVLTSTNDIHILHINYSTSKTYTIQTVEFNDTIVSRAHSGIISDMDVCVTKPTIVTCGVDRTIRIWNYRTKQLELCENILADMLSVSMHPLGYYVLVGCVDRLRLFHVLQDGLLQVCEFPVKACRVCHFSNGGRYFAAVNGHNIEVYETFTYKKHLTLESHTSKIYAFVWSNDDTKVVSAGLDGAAYSFNISKGGKQEAMWLQHGIGFSSLLLDEQDPSTDPSIYAIGTDMILKRMQSTDTTLYIPTFHSIRHLAKLPDSQCILATVADDGKPGSICCFSVNTPGQHDVYQCHSKPSTAIKIHGRRVFTASEDGTICIFTIQSPSSTSDTIDVIDAYHNTTVQTGEVALVRKQFINETNIRLEDMSLKLEALTNQMQFDIRKLNETHRAELKNNEVQREEETAAYKKSMIAAELKTADIEEKLTAAVQHEKHRVEDVTKALQESAEYINQLKEEHKKVLISDRENHQQDKKQTLETALLNEKEIANGVEQQHNMQVNALKAQIEQLTIARDESMKIHQRFLSDAIDAKYIDTEQVRLECAEKVSAECKEKYKSKALEIIERRRNEELQQQMLKIKNEMEFKEENYKKLQQEIDQRDRVRDTMQSELQDASKCIKEKEVRLTECDRKIKYLEQINSYSESTIKELNYLIFPKNDEVSELKDRVKQLEFQLESCYYINNQTSLEIPQLKRRNVLLQNDIQRVRKRLNESRNYIKSVQNEIFECARRAQETNQLKRGMRYLLKKYGRVDVEERVVEEGVEGELHRQRNHLERTIGSLRMKLKKDSAMHRTDNTKVMHENASLIREVNELRKDVHLLRQDQQSHRNKLLARKSVEHDKIANQLQTHH